MFIRTSLFSLLISCAVGLLSCGPAAEDRSTMMARSKQVQDSIADVIRRAMAEAETPAPNVVVVPSVVSTPSATPAQTPVSQPKK